MPPLIEEIGNVYGRLTVISHVGNGNGGARWLCQCVCGNTTIARGNALRNGRRKSCGCSRHGRVPHNRKDEVGNVYGKLTVLKEAGKTDGGMIQWHCRCECGNELIVTGGNLRSGNSKSCGCSSYDRIIPNAGAAKQALYAQYENQSKLRGYSWDITREEFLELTQRSCHYCGMPPFREWDSRSSAENYVYNGIDRVDNSMGYILDNVVPCCGVCNKAKTDTDYNEFLMWIERVNNHRLAWRGAMSNA